MENHINTSLIEEKASIENLRYQWAQALDEKNWDSLGNLFLDEVDTDYSAYGLQPSKMTREQLVGILKHSFSREGLKTQHLYSNFRIKIDGDIAFCRSNFIGNHHISNYEGGENFYLHGEYMDIFQRTSSGWKFKSLQLGIFFMTGNPQILVS
ncbi:MAG: nuclear transport factor 2 family protein [Leptospiraceae bacterium]|nr:nuclear transport factor 2 family protein [Leptospiraceae bacterium]